MELALRSVKLEAWETDCMACGGDGGGVLTYICSRAGLGGVFAVVGGRGMGHGIFLCFHLGRYGWG